MSFSPTAIPAAAAVTVGTSAVDINLPAGALLKLGVLLLQRSGDAGAVYWDDASDVTTSTGVLVAKGAPGVVGQYVIPKEYFDGLRTFYLISGTASQTVDVVLV